MKRRIAILMAFMTALSLLFTGCDAASVAEAAKSYGLAMKEAKQEEKERKAEKEQNAANEQPAEEAESPVTEEEVPAGSEETAAAEQESVEEAETAEEAETVEETGPVEEEEPAEETEPVEDLDDEARFDLFLDQYVKDELASDYTTMHWAYIDPEAAGVDRSSVEITLGDVEMDKDETLESIRELREELAEYDYDSLNRSQQSVYDQLMFDADITEKMLDDKYEYLDTIWSSNSGVHQVLISYFSEYFIYNEQDAEDMIVLVRDVPRFVDEALEYTAAQAEAGLLTIDYDLVIEDLDEVLESRQDSAIVSSYEKSVAELGLSEEEEQRYVDELREAMEECFYPSYEKIREYLTQLNDEGKILPLTALGALPNGSEYYELLMQEANGSTNTFEEVRDILLDQAMEAYLNMQQMIRKNSSLMNLDIYELKTEFSDIADIIYYDMSKYMDEFPTVNEMVFDLSGIDDERAGDFSAYFVVPPIDNTKAYQIRYNMREIGSEAETLSMFETLSHEGVPGHMYQAQFNHENLRYPAQFLYTNKAFSEGWATYAAMCAMKTLDTPDPELVRFYMEYMNFLQIYVTVLEMDLNYEGYDVDELVKVYGDVFGEEWLKDIYTLLADNRVYYMPYFYGTSMMLSLRSYAESELEDNFDPVEFHKVLLSEGSTLFDTVIKNIEEYVDENRP